MSYNEDYGIIDYIEEKIAKRVMKIQRKQQRRSQSQPHQGVLETTPQPTPIGGGRWEEQPQPASPPVQQTGNYVMTGTRMRDLGEWLQNHPLRQVRAQPAEGQEVATTTSQPRRRILTPPTEPQQAELKWYRCPNCRKNFQGQHQVCPSCQESIPDYVYARGSGRSDLSID